ncbi:S41 family peptidase [candidate division WOR-3 bacterium]|nr:S41 family peptidase [candidate division WOR-3 bacterium]
MTGKYLSNQNIKGINLCFIFLFITTLLNPCLCMGQEKMIKHKVSEGRSLTDTDHKEVIERVSELVIENYIYPDKGKEIADKIKQQYKEGKYSNITDTREFQEVLTTDLVEISKDAHLVLRPKSKVGKAGPMKVVIQEKPSKGAESEKVVKTIEGEGKAKTTKGPEESILKSLPGFGKYYNYGFEKVERLSGNIGYLDLRVFDDPRNEDAKATAEGAMALLANSDAIILDLRKNKGGTGAMANLIESYFFSDEPVHLLTNTTRYMGETFTQEDWTLKEINGKRLPEIDLYLLISNMTGSAAEHFVFALKGQNRATLVGETTGGAGHNVGFFPVLDLYDLTIPIGRGYNPITGEGWQETGIEPHIKVSAENALETAHKQALKNLYKKVTDERRKQKIKWILETLDAVYNPITIEKSLLKAYAGEYDNKRHITFKNGALYYSRDGMRRKHKLISITENQFLLDDVDDLRLKFVIKDQKELHIIYEDGRTQICNRVD